GSSVGARPSSIRSGDHACAAATAIMPANSVAQTVPRRRAAMDFTAFSSIVWSIVPPADTPASLWTAGARPSVGGKARLAQPPPPGWLIAISFQLLGGPQPESIWL